MPETCDPLKTIVTDDLFAAGLDVIRLVKQDAPHPYLLDAKIGDSRSEPLPETVIASTYRTPKSNISTKMAKIIEILAEIDSKSGDPLSQIAQRANMVIARAAIINRHNRRPPLYSESTIQVYIEIGLAVQEHSPLIRAAGYVKPPPVFTRNDSIDFLIADVAAQMVSSLRPKSPTEIFASLNRRQDALVKWPQLDLALFIRRTVGIYPDCQELYQPDQPWGKFISPKQLVANTVLRILSRDQKPRTTEYLTSETERLVGHLLPHGYNIRATIRSSAYESNDITRQGLSTFGLARWNTALGQPNTTSRRSSTGDLIFAFLIQNGPTDLNDIVEHVQGRSNTKRRTIQEAINHDPENRFIRLPDRRVAADPIPHDHNPDASPLQVVPDRHHHRPAPVLGESELLWITHLVQALNNLAPPLPQKVALTGARAVGFAQDEPMDITVVVNDDDKPDLGRRLAQIASDTSGLVTTVHPNITILTASDWEHQQMTETRESHHSVWLSPDKPA